MAETTPLLTANLLHIGGKGLDDVRAIVDAVRYQPPPGHSLTVLLVEDPGSLSDGAVNALLKTMEEPPEHVRIVATLTRRDLARSL